MTNELKVVVLDIKSLTHFVVREEETLEAQRYAKLEQLLQKSYENSLCEDKPSLEPLEVGSCVAVHLNPFDKRLPKLWVRAVVKNIFQGVGGFLFSVYLVDYGLEKCCNKLSIRELKPHLGKAFVQFQAFDFHLFGIQSENGIKSRQVIKFIKQVLSDNHNVVLAQIQSRNRLGSALGSISLSNGLDLASVLVEKQFAIDISGGKLKKNVTQLDENCSNNQINSCIDNPSVRKPHSSPFIRSANNSFVINPEHIPESPPKHTNNQSLDSTRKESPNSTVNKKFIHLSPNESPKATNIASTSNRNAMNGINGLRRKKLSELLKDVQESKQSEENSKEESHSERTLNDSNGYYKIETEGKDQEEIDWPVFESNNSYMRLKPAGCGPPPEFYDKFFTLKRD